MEQLEKAADLLAKDARVLVLTGAGISAESGVPTFRGEGGLWRGLSAMELASVEGFKRNPELVLSWYQSRRSLLRSLQPNPGHKALVKLETQCRHFHLVTQNVDNLHRMAGSASVTELHGNIWIDRCSECSWQIRLKPHQPLENQNHCPQCGALRRPGVVWFGETLPVGAMESAMTNLEKASTLLVIGTSAAVYPAAGLIDLARAKEKTILEINTERSQASPLCDMTLLGKSASLLPKLVQHMEDASGAPNSPPF